MAEIEEPQFSSVKERIAALRLQQVGLTPASSISAPGRTNVDYKKPRPPPPPPPPPPSARPVRSVSGASCASSPSRNSASAARNDSLNSVRRSSAGASVRNGQAGSGGTSGGTSGEEKCPALPPRRPLMGATRQQAHTPPPLPARRGTAASASASASASAAVASAVTERDVTRKGSFESISSVRSGRSSLSMRTVSTGNTGYSSGEQSGRVLKAPPFNSSMRPSLALSGEEDAEDAPFRGAPLHHVVSDSIVTEQGLDHKSRRESQGEVNEAVCRPPLPCRPKSHIPNGAALANAVGVNGSPRSTSVGLSTPPPLPPSRFKQGLPPPVPVDRQSQVDGIQDHLQISRNSDEATSECLLCRDFSAADEHATQFPRSSVPGGDLGWLAHQLTAPFASLTDRARVIFTWMHHNIAYDTDAFFSGNKKSATPASTFQTGLAVCAGYAGLYNAIATHAGLESICINGHSKGYGYKPPSAHSPVPAFKSTHAWNAVRIDDGQWKLIDSTWGAGHTCSSTKRYVKEFNPPMFTMDNDEFGLRHFPTDPAHSFYPADDGRPAPSWESYILADAHDKPEKLTVYGKARAANGIDPRSFTPAEKRIRLSRYTGPDAETVRFEFRKICPHWVSERQGLGKPYLFLLALGKKDYVPFQSDGQMYWSWCDVPVGKLRDVVRVARDARGAGAGACGGGGGGAGGSRGEGDENHGADDGADDEDGVKISVYALTRFGERDGRGVTMAEYLKLKGKVGMSFDAMAAWILV